MSDIQRINIHRPIDNGGITFGLPPSSKEGKNSEKETQNLSQTSSNLLNEYKLRNQPREELLFPTLYSLMKDGSLGIYQSNLPYPGLSNYSLSSKVELGINPVNFFTYNHHIWTYNDLIYIAFPSSNIKYLDNYFNISEININNRFDYIFTKNDQTIFTVIDNNIYEVDLSTNSSTLYGQLDSSIPYPLSDILYDVNTNRFAIADSPNNTIYVTDNQLSIVSSYDMYNQFDVYLTEDVFFLNQDGSIYINNTRSSTQNSILEMVLDISTLTITSSPTSKLIKKSKIDLFNSYQGITNLTDGVFYLYKNQNLLGSIDLNIVNFNKVLMVDTNTNLLILWTENNNRNIYVLTDLLNNKLSLVTELD